MKTAKWIVTAMEITCPYCNEIIPAPNGSLFWTREEIDAAIVVNCRCGKNSSVHRIYANH